MIVTPSLFSICIFFSPREHPSRSCGKNKKKKTLPGMETDNNSISSQLEERFNEHKYALSVKPKTSRKVVFIRISHFSCKKVKTDEKGGIRSK